MAARHRSSPRRANQRGAALLLAMLVLVLVATTAAAMVWQQWRGIEIESAERERAQGTWLLNGALDWARLILREDARNGGADHLGEPWATPLAESRLSTFLAAGQDANHTLDDAAGIDAFMSGQITDAQARYNLQNLIDTDENAPKDLAAFKRLCDALSLPSDTATRIAQNFRLSQSTLEEMDTSADSSGRAGRNALLVPQKVSELSWYGIEPEIIHTLEPYVVILPQRTAVNANTAPAQVLMTAAEGIDRGTAERLVQARQAKPFQTLDDLKPLVPTTVQLSPNDIDVHSAWFEVTGQLRYEQHILRQRTLVMRRGLDVNVVRSERLPPETP